MRGLSLDYIFYGQGDPYIKDTTGSEGQDIMDEDQVVSDLLMAARRVLKSGNPLALDALERNIHYFDHAVAQENELRSVKAEVTELKRIVLEIQKTTTAQGSDDPGCLDASKKSEAM